MNKLLRAAFASSVVLPMAACGQSQGTEAKSDPLEAAGMTIVEFTPKQAPDMLCVFAQRISGSGLDCFPKPTVSPK